MIKYIRHTHHELECWIRYLMSYGYCHTDSISSLLIVGLLDLNLDLRRLFVTLNLRKETPSRKRKHAH